MDEILDHTAFSTDNYDALLQAWSGLGLRSSVSFSANATKYSISSVAARDVLTNVYSWSIDDAGLAN
jgi:hypothetical protein